MTPELEELAQASKIVSTIANSCFFVEQKDVDVLHEAMEDYAIAARNYFGAPLKSDVTARQASDAALQTEKAFDRANSLMVRGERSNNESSCP